MHEWTLLNQHSPIQRLKYYPPLFLKIIFFFFLLLKIKKTSLAFQVHYFKSNSPRFHFNMGSTAFAKIGEVETFIWRDDKCDGVEKERGKAGVEGK